MRAARLILPFLVLVSVSAASAEEPAGATTAVKPMGLDLSFRFGPAVSGGERPASSEPMFPLWLGLGYRIGGVWYVGVSGVFAFPTTSCACYQPDNVQFLVEAAFHPLAYSRIDPWIGLGFGGEWFGGSGSFLPGMFELGISFELARSIRVGPFYAFQFVLVGTSTHTFHTWNVFGLQLTGLP